MRCSFLPQDLYAMFLSQVIFLRQNEPSQALCHLCDLAIKNGNRAMEICNSKCVSNSSQAKWTTESPLQSRCEEHCAIRYLNSAEPLSLTQQGTGIAVPWE